MAKLAETKGYNELLLVGGSKLNGAFLEAGLIDEIILDIHPLILGSGIKLFSEVDALQKFTRVSVQELEQGQLLVRYQKANINLLIIFMANIGFISYAEALADKLVDYLDQERRTWS